MSFRLLRLWLPPVIFGSLVLLGWQLIVTGFKVPQFLLPSPSEIGTQIKQNFEAIREASKATATNALYGLVIGVILGLLVAIVAVWWRVIGELVSPLAAAAAAIPIVAVAPVFYGMYSATSEIPRRLVVAVVVFFPIFISAVKGLRQVSAVHNDLMHSYAVSGPTITRVVRIPNAIPFIFTGLRVAAPNAVIAAIIAEYFGGAQNGLGSRIISAASNTAYARAWAYVSASIALGLIFFVVILLFELIATKRMATTQ